MEYQLEELSIELSARCACRCIMCSSGSTPKPLPNELTSNEVESLIKQARELGATVLSFSGGDPILLHDIIPEYIRLALYLGYEQVLFYTTGISHSFNECGSLSTADGSQAFRGESLFHLLQALHHVPESTDKVVFVFSLHSHRAYVHDYIMGLTGAWSATVASIQDVRDAGYKAWVHMVPMLPNWQDVVNLRALCGQLGVEKMSLLRYVPQTRGRANRRRLALAVDEFEELQNTIVDISLDDYASAQCMDPSTTIMRFGCPIDFRHTVDINFNEKLHPCHAGTDLILVRPQGDVHPCAAWKTLPDDANVRNNTLKEIWETSDVFLAIRKFREDGWADLAGPCSACSYIGSCKGGCPAQKLHWLSINIKADVSICDLNWPIADPLCPLHGLG